jgi:hypothetical protein
LYDRGDSIPLQTVVQRKLPFGTKLADFEKIVDMTVCALSELSNTGNHPTI